MWVGGVVKTGATEGKRGLAIHVVPVSCQPAGPRLSVPDDVTKILYFQKAEDSERPVPRGFQPQQTIRTPSTIAMPNLHVQFQVPAERKHHFLVKFACAAPSLRSKLAIDLEPFPGFENILEHGGTIYATQPRPDQIYDEVGSKFFHAAVGNGRIIFKFASGPGVLEDMKAEATVYDTLKDLQGSVIPLFKGLYTVADDPDTMCLITSDVGDSLAEIVENLSEDARSVLACLPLIDSMLTHWDAKRIKIAHLVAALMYGKKIGLPDIDDSHILYDAKSGRYWLHDFHDTYEHVCRAGRAPRKGDPATNRIFEMFPCFFLQEEIRALKLWN